LLLSKPAAVYYAIVQIASGGARIPNRKFVQAKVKGLAVSFAVGDESHGAVTAPD